MPITPRFSDDDIKRMFEPAINAVVERQIQRLSYLGELCAKEAKENHTYNDDTGALTGSFGYFILIDGILYSLKFSASAHKIAVENYMSIIEITSLSYNHGVVLVVVAGMNYALYVESKGYNVLSSSEHLAQKELPRMLADLNKNIDLA